MIVNSDEELREILRLHFNRISDLPFWKRIILKFKREHVNEIGNEKIYYKYKKWRGTKYRI